MEAAQINGMESGFWNDLKTVLPGLLLAVLGLFLVEITLSQAALSVLLFAVCIYPYFLLHELLHAVVYMAASGRPVQIRFTKFGAVCGAPEGYFFRSAALTCTAAPLVLLGILFPVGWAAAVMAKHWLFFLAGLLLAFHLLGCRSDINLLREIGKYKGREVLVRDQGDRQWIFVRKG